MNVPILIVLFDLELQLSKFFFDFLILSFQVLELVLSFAIFFVFFGNMGVEFVHLLPEFEVLIDECLDQELLLVELPTHLQKPLQQLIPFLLVLLALGLAGGGFGQLKVHRQGADRQPQGAVLGDQLVVLLEKREEAVARKVAVWGLFWGVFGGRGLALPELLGQVRRTVNYELLPTVPVAPDLPAVEPPAVSVGTKQAVDCRHLVEGPLSPGPVVAVDIVGVQGVRAARVRGASAVLELVPGGCARQAWLRVAVLEVGLAPTV